MATLLCKGKACQQEEWERGVLWDVLWGAMGLGAVL